MQAARAELTVGLVRQGGPDWIAGVVYLENIVRATLAVGGNRLSLCFVAGPDQQFGAGSNLTLDVPTYVYTHRLHQPWSQISWNSAKSRRLPESLETLARRLGLSVLFPLQTPPSGQLPIPWVGWIPDFQHKRRPEFFSVACRAERDSRFQRIVDEAPHVVVSSQDARADLMRWFPMPDARVSVLQFRSVLNPRWFDVDPHTVTDRFDLPAKYLTYPSQLWAHKNHRTVLAALSLLRARGKTDVVVVCTGREHDLRHPEYADGLRREIVERGLQSQVRLLGLLDRATQIQVVRGSAAVIQASCFEGWSALIEDARALGKRTFVSDIPVHREQNPRDALYFDPDNAEQLADLIEHEWPHLAPGLDPARERCARVAQETLTREFACRFLDLVGRAGCLAT
jgi:glycosyltransferase involved in cell wall biosynthesis